MTKYAIVHMSDLQFGSKFRWQNANDFSRIMSADIKECLERHSAIPVYVVVSGDIAESSIAAEYVSAETEMNHLLDEISLGKERAIFIPGNHDVNFDLADVAASVGDGLLKYSQYNKFASQYCQGSVVTAAGVSVVSDNRLGLQFVLINSNIEISRTNNAACVCLHGLREELDKNLKTAMLKIAVCHHRVDIDEIKNSREVEAVLLNNGISIYLSGHHHEHTSRSCRSSDGTLHCIGSGSTGVNKTQREDGISNQYCLHLIDIGEKTFSTIWRRYNPRKSTKYGQGGWTHDDTHGDAPTAIPISWMSTSVDRNRRMAIDQVLYSKLKLLANPFTQLNAEKISEDQIFDLFVQCEHRHRSATRLEGDAIIRGQRGAGKTMLLRYLHVLALHNCRRALAENRISPVFPVYINLALSSHKSDFGGSDSDILTILNERLSSAIIAGMEGFSKSSGNKELSCAIVRLKDKLSVMKSNGKGYLGNLGDCIRDMLHLYFGKVIFLIDEVAPCLPRSFFQKADNGESNGFVAWMNTIRNSGPYFTRIAVYPNDVSDQLNEDRFGEVVNLEYDIRKDDELAQYRVYAIKIIENYLRHASPDAECETGSIIKRFVIEDPSSVDDALEQMLFASDGSTRRLSRIMDKCIEYLCQKESPGPMTKVECIEIIKGMARNLQTSYRTTDQEIADRVSATCKRQGTFKFRSPGNKPILHSLHSAREEINILRLAESGSGKRGLVYELTYPFCLLWDIPTHSLKEHDGKRVDHSRSSISGKWISATTTVKASDIVISHDSKTVGEVREINDDLAEIVDRLGKKYLTDDLIDGMAVGSRVSFLSTVDGIAFDLCLL